MTKFERWFLKRIIREEVRQDRDHDKKHIALYQMIRDAHREEFTEDNVYTADDYSIGSRNRDTFLDFSFWCSQDTSTRLFCGS